MSAKASELFYGLVISVEVLARAKGDPLTEEEMLRVEGMEIQARSLRADRRLGAYDQEGWFRVS